MSPDDRFAAFVGWIIIGGLGTLALLLLSTFVARLFRGGRELDDAEADSLRIDVTLDELGAEEVENDNSRPGAAE